MEAVPRLIRAQGYAATSVDDICHRAGVKKGSFFYHFKSKDELAVAALSHFLAWTDEYFAAAAYRTLKDPLDRLFGYVDFRVKMIQGELPDYTCPFGTILQETYATHPAIREACDRAMTSHIEYLTRDVQAAKELYAPLAAWTSESVSNLIQVVLQGSFILAKAKQGPDVVLESLEHLRRYLGFLFNQTMVENREGKT